MDQATFQKSQRVRDKISRRIGLPKIYAQCKPYREKICVLSERILRMKAKTIADLGVMVKAFWFVQESIGGLGDVEIETKQLAENITRLAGTKLPKL